MTCLVMEPIRLNGLP